jgi:nucleoside 2-deoxyribosyltransferase
MSQTTKDKIFNNDLQGLQVADLTVALVAGQDIDAGTAAEIGFSFATGKPVIAITASERRFRNLFVEGMFAYKVKAVQETRPTISLVDSSGRNP